MKYNNIIKSATIVVVCIIICMPSIFANRDENKISLIENKRLASMPSLEDTGGFNSEYINRLETYVDDNIGFKQNAIIFKTGFLYFCFEKLNLPNYFMGKEQNIFYSGGMTQINNYQGKIQLAEEDVERLISDLEVWNEIVKREEGIFFFMAIPDKEGIYPEFYPESVLRIDNRTRIDCLAEKMISKEWFVNIRDALIAEKGDKMLYYRNFDPTHWNMNGAWVGYKELMSNITSVYEDVKMFTEEDVIFSYEQGPGTPEALSSIESMGKIMKFKDELVSCIPADGFEAEQVNNAVIPLKDGQIYYHYVNEHIDGRTLLIVGDSYIYSFLLPLLAESFSDVYFTNFVGAETIVELQRAVKPDVVVLETVDRAFYFWPMIEQLELIAELNENSFV